MIAAWAILLSLGLFSALTGSEGLQARFGAPPPGTGPWVFWYWVEGAVSQDGIRADLEAMRDAGIDGAYLFFVRRPADPPLFEPAAVPLTDRWWQMLRFAFYQADRLGLKLGIHACDGFSLAAGPWITPELSMQRLTWSMVHVKGPGPSRLALPRPPAREGYYRDVAILAFPCLAGAGISTTTLVPRVTTSTGVDAQYLVMQDNTQSFHSDGPCWIQYEFPERMTCRSIRIRPAGSSFQALRLRIQASDDGRSFHPVQDLVPPRHGWQDRDPLGCPEYTYAIRPTTARFFRFVHDPAGTEPGSEDLDTAKWRPSLRIQYIELSSEPRIDQFEGKSGLVWRLSARTTRTQVPDQLCLRPAQIMNLTRMMDPNGILIWDVPDGNWTILRMGHTSTGQRNTTGSGAIGLECDRFNQQAVRLQFERWFGQIRRMLGPELSSRVLKVFHTDSWESGSQNWTATFLEDFAERRGYDLLPYLPVMAGIPVGSADISERVLYDVRQTIAELLAERFFGTLADLAHENGCQFSAECTAPTMLGDGMQHFSHVDIPMGEFWLNSPTHDKPTDILEAISAAHVYGRCIVQAEALTQLRLGWDEDLARIKPLGDLHLASGINRLVVHVFVHNPWLDRRPGMTLGPIGLFFQRDQTWWPHARAWVDYIRRCQLLLQTGRPVVDIAVFTGQQIPRRAVLPERLIQTLPGLIRPEIIERHAARIANQGQPLRQMPPGVVASANIRDPNDWIDPLGGYAYDSINPDALIHSVRIDKDIPALQAPSGICYRVLVVPAANAMMPEPGMVSPEMAERLLEIADAGIPILMGQTVSASPSLTNYPDCDQQVAQIGLRLQVHPSVRIGPFTGKDLRQLGIQPDLLVHNQPARIAWCHRRSDDLDIYFVSNQSDANRAVDLSLRVAGRIPELWDPLTGQVRTASSWQTKDGRTYLPLHLDPHGSVFIVLGKPADKGHSDDGPNWTFLRAVLQIEGPWMVGFDPALGGPNEPVTFKQLEDWSKHPEPQIHYYSGTATYTTRFDYPCKPTGQTWLDLGRVCCVAQVSLNGTPCGTAWTWPYRVDITRAIRKGTNTVEIRVTNTWANRLIGDSRLDRSSRLTWTTAADRATGPLRPAGLLGPVRILACQDPR